MKKLLFLFVITMLAFTTLLCPGKKTEEGAIEEDAIQEEGAEENPGTPENPQGGGEEGGTEQ